MIRAGNRVGVVVVEHWWQHVTIIHRAHLVRAQVLHDVTNTSSGKKEGQLDFVHVGDSVRHVWVSPDIVDSIYESILGESVDVVWTESRAGEWSRTPSAQGAARLVELVTNMRREELATHLIQIMALQEARKAPLQNQKQLRESLAPCSVQEFRDAFDYARAKDWIELAPGSMKWRLTDAGRVESSSAK